jgi:hypothetical protein
MFNRFVTLALACVPLFTPAAAAQDLSAGDRVRVHFSEVQAVMVGPTVKQDSVGVETVGVMDHMRADSLYLTPDRSEDMTAIPLAAVSTIEVSHGSTKSKLWLGSGIGFAVGFVPMFAACTAGGCGDQEDYGACCIGYGSLAGLGGALLGALVGSAFKTERWEELPLEGVRTSITANQIAVHVAF